MADSETPDEFDKAADEAAAVGEVPLTINGYPFTEDGVALAFADLHQDRLRYDHTRGSWYVWTGKAWRRDETKLAFSWARRICRETGKQAAKMGKPKAAVSKAAFAAAVERFAISDENLAVTSIIWDSDPYLLGTPEGTVDLRTGILRDPDPHDYITKLTASPPAVIPECPLWLEFLDQVTDHNAELVRFLRQWCGYCLTGDTREQALVFAYGTGGNGKGVFLNTVSRIMGDYCRNAAMETFTASTKDKHTTDLAMLRGARMVTASESEEGRAWAESRIKQLTGGDAITARFMRQDNFEYVPQFKLTMIGNHQPILRNVGDAERRRFNMVPFKFKPKSADRFLEKKLQDEWPAILRWMIEGCLDWNMNGLIRPSVIAEATNNYFSEQDSVSLWIDERCETGAMKSDTLENLFKSWSAFATASGEKATTTKWLSQTLAKIPGCVPVRHAPENHAKRGFKGIQVRIAKPADRTQSQSQNDDDLPEPGW
jgi:putative DNA primase/helicase